MSDNTEKSLIITPEEFNITQEFPLFTVLYAMSKEDRYNDVKEWIVTGHRLENSSTKRNMNTLLMSHPISVYIVQVEHNDLDSLRNRHFVSTDKNEVINQKKELLTNKFNELMKGL